MLSVPEATEIILANPIDFGQETIPFELSLGRVLAEDLVADRDFPPFDRVTMDGIAIRWESFEAGQRSFKIENTQMAGQPQLTLHKSENCIEVMTGAMLPVGTDTVVRYEDVSIEEGIAHLHLPTLKHRQNIHFQGEDRFKGSIILSEGRVIGPPQVALAASIGATKVKVKRLPKVVIITSGDELVPVQQIPLPYQIRMSNGYSIAALLQPYGLTTDFLHIADDLEQTQKAIQKAFNQYDALILSGGVSQGKKDFIHLALNNLGVHRLFHKVAQQPGKPFWFGRKENCVVFALPGNPVSSFLCVRRYFVPWLRKSLGLPPMNHGHASLAQDYFYASPLTYFLQVRLKQVGATLTAEPIVGHGSGDFANLSEAQGFIELPEGKKDFKQGEILQLWHYESIF
ncbi:MAG: molybdopterin molybdotransferase MoeA [Runella sp.]